jgi:hypothetical protein
MRCPVSVIEKPRKGRPWHGIGSKRHKEKTVLISLSLPYSFQLPLSIQIFSSQPCSRVRRVKKEQSMVDSWQKKVLSVLHSIEI